MNGKRALIAVAGGALSAIAWLSVTLGVAGGMLLSYFAPLPLFWVGLTSGRAAAAIAGIAGMLVAGMLSSLAALEAFFLLHAVPAWMIVAIALTRRPAAGGNGSEPVAAGPFTPTGLILASLAVAATAALIVFGLVEGGGERSIEEAVTAFIEGFALAPAGGEGPPLQPFAVLAPLAPVFLGFVAMAWQMMVVINAALAQALAVRTGMALRPSPAWSALRLPDWLSWLLVAAAALALIAGGDVGFLAQNAAVALSVPYFFAGLAVIHRLAARTAARRMTLIVFYMFLVIIFLVMVVVVTGIGIVDQWVRSARDRGRQLQIRKD